MGCAEAAEKRVDDVRAVIEVPWRDDRRAASTLQTEFDVTREA
jgi:hypothetical protein